MLLGGYAVVHCIADFGHNGELVVGELDVVEVVADEGHADGEAGECVGIAHAEELPGALGKGVVGFLTAKTLSSG